MTEKGETFSQKERTTKIEQKKEKKKDMPFFPVLCIYFLPFS